MIKKLEKMVLEGRIRYFQIIFNEDNLENNYQATVLTNGGLIVSSEDTDLNNAIKVLLKDINEN